MDRNREARRTPVSTSNGVSRRRHRGSSFRDSPEEEVPTMKKDQGRDRDRCSRSKRRRRERIHGSCRDEGEGRDQSTDESVNDFEEFDEEEDVAAAHLRLISNPNSILMNTHQRKTFPPAKFYKATPSWKNADEIIGFSVPRKARSASTKRAQESWIAGGVRSASPARLAAVGSSPAVVSPSSSNASARKKTKGSGVKNRGLKSMSKSPPSSSNRDEIEFEIAEVLFGLRQNHGSKLETESTVMKFECRDSSISSNCNPKISSRVSPPPISVVAPKRKRPRQPKCEDEHQPFLLTERVSPLSFSTKLEEEHLHKQHPCSPPITEKTRGSENGVHIPFADPVNHESYTISESKPPNQTIENHVVSMVEEQELAESPPIKKESPPLSSKEILAGFDMGDQVGEKKMQFLIDLMAPPPPPQTKASPEIEIKKKHSSSESKNMEFKPQNPTTLIDDPVEETLKKITLDIGIDVEKNTETDKKLNLKPCVEQRVTETTGPVPPPVTSNSSQWTGGVQSTNYIGGVMPVESSIQSSQPLFSKPRPKRCATHCYIASSISSHQKVVRMSPFWQPLANPSLFSKPCNVAVLQAGEAAAAATNPAGKGVVAAPDKGPDGFSVKDKPPLQASNFVDSSPRTPQILLQQAPANILGPAFLFPVNQQHQAGAGVASPRPSSGKQQQPPMNISSTPAPPTSPIVSMSFSYPSIPPNDTQYLAILQNNPYPFSVPPYPRGPHPHQHPHPHVLPFFNSPLYSAPVIHPPPPPAPSRHLPAPKSRPPRLPDHPDSSREDTADSRPDKRPKPDSGHTRKPPLDPDISSAEDDKKNPARSIAFSPPPPRQILHLQKPHPAVSQRGKILTMNPGPVSVFPGPAPPQWKTGPGGKSGSSSSSQHRSGSGGGGQISFGGKTAAPATGATPYPSPAAPSSAVKGNGKGRVGLGNPAGFAGKPAMELSKQAWHQAQLFFSGQFGPPPPSGAAGGGVYYGQKRRNDQPGPASSASMLTLCSPGPATSDPAKAAAMAALASKAGGGQFSLGPGFTHPHPGAAQQQQQQQGKSGEQKGE